MIPVKILVQTHAHGFAVLVPGVPGINAVGETRDQAIGRARKLIRERLLAQGQNIDSLAVAGQLMMVDLNGPVS